MNPDRAAAVARLAELITRIERPHPVRVAVDGLTGSGKTTLANDLAPAIRVRARPCIRAGLDGFHRPAAERHRAGRSSPDGYYEAAFDLDAVVEVLLAPLGPGGDRRYQTAIHEVSEDRALAPPVRRADRHAVLVVDGMFLQRPELRSHWDCVIWVDCDEEIARARAVQRDRGSFGPEVDALYRERYLPAQRRYVREHDPAAHALVRVVTNDPEHPVLAVRR